MDGTRRVSAAQDFAVTRVIPPGEHSRQTEVEGRIYCKNTPEKTDRAFAGTTRGVCEPFEKMNPAAQEDEPGVEEPATPTSTPAALPQS
jgi:hypothetical protein